MSIDPAFLQFLATNGRALADLLRVAEAFVRRSGEVAVPTSTAGGPPTFVIGGIPALTTMPLDPYQLDAIEKGMAEAHVKERAIAYLAGVLTGIMVAA